MKKLIKLFLVIVTISMASCNSSDDPILLIDQTVSGTLDTTALLSLLGNDATALVTLNGEAAATYTTEASIGEEILYEVKTVSSDIEIVILDFFYTSGNREFWVNGIETSVDSESSISTASLKIVSGVAGDEVKFGFTFAIKTNGMLDMNTTYIVDPKIKIRS